MSSLQVCFEREFNLQEQIKERNINTEVTVLVLGTTVFRSSLANSVMSNTCVIKFLSIFYWNFSHTVRTTMSKQVHAQFQQKEHISTMHCGVVRGGARANARGCACHALVYRFLRRDAYIMKFW